MVENSEKRGHVVQNCFSQEPSSRVSIVASNREMFRPAEAMYQMSLVVHVVQNFSGVEGISLFFSGFCRALDQDALLSGWGIVS